MVSNLRRLAADHAALHSKLPPYYVLPQDDAHFPGADDLSQLNVLLTGPPGTPYSNGLWRLHLKMPEDYPNSPPKATFRTRIWHPNVEEQTGAVCVDTLKRDWQSKLTLRDVLITISCLLIQPNPDSALNSTAGNLLREDYDTFAHQAKLMTSIHAPIQSDLQPAVKEAKHRGEDPSSIPRDEDSNTNASAYSQRPRKQQRTRSNIPKKTSHRSNTPEFIPPPRDIVPPPQPMIGEDQMQISDDENENDDPVSASKENNPSLSPTPLHLAPPSIRPRKNAFGKRPLSVLSIAYPEDPDTDMMLVDSESDQDNGNGTSTSNSLSASSSDKNIAANSFSAVNTNFSRPLRKSPSASPQRKTPRLGPSRRENTPTRFREDVQIYEDVPDRTLLDASRRFGADGKENRDTASGSRGLKEARGLHTGQVGHSVNSSGMLMGLGLNSTNPLVSPGKNPLQAKKVLGGVRKGLNTKMKPRIGVRRL
ncbi:Ubiquitin-conjugating enzyme E2 [Penicillium angulare]|uniref:Ubiquitin-conjugating enzyme E2 2 n=1 Tax=Penicillium angulare TaxID=116970 RepID=A0A9W9FBF4_9EURO|nr:Ubiquitin-conjugating enzyme E2 [Penicillium angulare]